MTGLDFLKKLNKEGRLKLVEPSAEISRSYLIKSDNCIKSARILHNEGLHENSVAEAYYSMYNAVLSLLFRCGIKCENHSAAIIILDEVFGMDELKSKLSFAKKERIDKQYYTSDTESARLTEEAAGKMLEDAEDFALKIKSFLGRIKTGEVKDYQKVLEEKIKY